MVDISRKNNERNGIETIVDNNEIFWLNEKHIEKFRLYQKNVWEIMIKYHSDHRKHKYKLVEEQKNLCNKIFIDEKIGIKVIMDCRTTSAHKSITRLRFKQYNFILTKEKIMDLFEGENM